LPTPIPAKSISIDPILPTDIYDALKQKVEAFAKNASNVVVTTTEQADVRIAVASEGAVLLTKTLAVAAPFPTLADGIALSDLKRFWSGDPSALIGMTNEQKIPPTLFLDADTRATLVQILGAPKDSIHIQLLQTTDVLSETWKAREAAFAILPFGKLEARWKLLSLDNINLFEREADMSRYPLTLRVRASGDAELVKQLSTAIQPTDNRDLSKMTIVAMTGVTAMVRGTAVRMEEKGITYPGEKIRDWLRTADIAHISNEVSFWDKCRKPTRFDGVVMCSSPAYTQLLEYIGADVIELTGNHTWDYGADKLLGTLDLYDQLGWKYFGGGRNLSESRAPLTMTLNGNRIAFVGCNYFGANWATDKYAGSTPCGINNPQQFDWIVPEIQRLKGEGYLVIATLQYTEFYEYAPTRQQDIDFRKLREAGAVVVNGSQGHHVQGFDVSENGFLHYGTGNLFFGDQEWSRGAQQTMVDRHVFYDNKYVGADLRTARIEDISQPVPMSVEERTKLLGVLFKSSGY
jgi:poly-gamma-glutamate synthesis protein (capsule biosynthesis protein)